MTARSYLDVPGDAGRRLNKAASPGADAVIANMEDAAAPAREQDAVDAFEKLGPSRRTVEAHSDALAAGAAAYVDEAGRMVDDSSIRLHRRVPHLSRRVSRDPEGIR